MEAEVGRQIAVTGTAYGRRTSKRRICLGDCFQIGICMSMFKSVSLIAPRGVEGKLED